MTILEKILSISTRLGLGLYLCLAITQVQAGQGDIYKFKWLDKNKQVYVLQSKMHPNKGKFYLNVGYGTSTLSKFNDSTNLHGNLGFYLSEEWALEGFFSKYSNKENVAYRAINTQVNNQASLNVYPHVVRIDQMYGLNLVFSPFYGKINTFNKIFYIDWNFGLGLGMSDYEHNTAILLLPRGSVINSDAYESDSTMSGIFKSQVKWHLTKNLKINLDYHNYFSKLPDLGEDTKVNNPKIIRSWDLMVSLGLMF